MCQMPFQSPAFLPILVPRAFSTRSVDVAAERSATFCRCRSSVAYRRVTVCAQESPGGDHERNTGDEHRSRKSHVRSNAWRPPSKTPPIEERSQLLEMYYSADETNYQPQLANAWILGSRNFVLELRSLFGAIRRLVQLDLPSSSAPPDCLGLTLSNRAVAVRERARNADPALRVSTSFPIRLLYKTVCVYIDLAFRNRPIPRLWFLEVVARIPYFSYTSCLHLLATLGWWRSPELMNIHHSEELNEAYHLAVMEALGGDKRWIDRFTAFHAAILYYWFLVLSFFMSPTQSYAFSQLLESHAVDTYAQFLEENEALLRALPAPEIAEIYFRDFMYYFEEFQMDEHVRRPEIHNLYDVFQNIMLDEVEHVKTMTACREQAQFSKPIRYKGRSVRARSRSLKKPMTQDQRDVFWRKWKNRAEKLEADEEESE